MKLAIFLLCVQLTDITIRVDRSVNDVLELAKAQGYSKKDLFQRAIRHIQFVDNFITDNYDFKTTALLQNDVLQLKFMERVREEQVVKGATSVELVAFDEVIRNIRDRLKFYREHNGDEGDV